MSTRDVHLLEFHARVTGPSSILRQLDAILPPARESRITRPEQPTTWFDVSLERAPTRIYCIRQGGKPIWCTDQRDGVVQYLAWALNQAAIQCHQAYHLVHAGAVATRDRGVVLPGAHGSGKTTLVAALISRGFEYLSDEVGVLDPSTHDLLPFPKSLHVREGSRALLAPCFPQLQRARAYRSFDGTAIWYLQPRGEWIARQPVPLRYIILPEYRWSGSTSLEPIPRSEALQCFVEQSFNLHQHGVSGIERIVGMLRGTECYRVMFGEAHDAAAAIDALISSPSARTTLKGGGHDGLEPRRIRRTASRPR